jgi:hypothetical protein
MDERRAFRPASRVGVAAALLVMLSSAGPATFEVALWTGDDRIESRWNVVATHSHPCGTIAIVRLDRMPRHKGSARAALDTELIVEAGSDGPPRERWSVPVDYEPIAIRGREILIDHAGQRLWIGTNRRIRRAAPGGTYPPPVPLQCPAHGAHSASDYALCANLMDLESGRRRSIQYEAPCT